MRNNNKSKKKMSLETQTVRSLQHSTLASVGGGWNLYTEAEGCTITQRRSCTATPGCPM
jgi:hypothetical protein